jgi:hypothetical protein
MSARSSSAASFVALAPAEGPLSSGLSTSASSSGSGSGAAPAAPAAFWGAVHALLHPLPPRRRTTNADGSDAESLSRAQRADPEEAIGQDQVRASVSRVLKLADGGFGE